MKFHSLSINMDDYLYLNDLIREQTVIPVKTDLMIHIQYNGILENSVLSYLWQQLNE